MKEIAITLMILLVSVQLVGIGVLPGQMGKGRPYMLYTAANDQGKILYTQIMRTLKHSGLLERTETSDPSYV